MAGAIVKGLLEKKHYAPFEIGCTGGSHPSPSGSKLAADTGIQYFADMTAAIRESEAVVLACKPQKLKELNPELIEAADGKLVLSVLAGTSLARLSGIFKSARNVVRTMPNTPSQIGAGVTGFASLNPLSNGDRLIVENALGALGKYYEVKETDLDALTAMSGSGPAYVFEFAAALREAGTNAGLDKDLAQSLAIHTLLGASKLMAQSSDGPEDLRNGVTSPGGTTAAALKVFSDHDLRGIVDKAIAAAVARSLELSKE